MPEFILPMSNPDVPELPSAGQLPGSFDRNAGNIIGHEDSPALQATSYFFGYANDEWDAINTLRQKPDDEDRAATHDRKVRERCDAFDTGYGERWDTAKAKVALEQTAIESTIKDKCGLKLKPEWIDSVTGTFHAMKPGDRMQAATRLVEDGDTRAIAILLEAPLPVSGFTNEQRNNLKHLTEMKFASKEVERRERLATAYDRLEKASIDGIRSRMRLRDGTHKGAWKDRAAKAAAINVANNAANFGRR